MFKVFLFINVYVCVCVYTEFYKRLCAPSVVAPCLHIEGGHVIVPWGWLNAVNRELMGRLCRKACSCFLIPSRNELASTFMHHGCSCPKKIFFSTTFGSFMTRNDPLLSLQLFFIF